MNFKQLNKKYPDLRKLKDLRLGNFFASRGVNSHVTDILFFDGCDCCPDRVHMAYPFLIEDGVRIFSMPYSFCIADRDFKNLVYLPREGWTSEAQSAGLPSEIIQKAYIHLQLIAYTS